MGKTHSTQRSAGCDENEPTTARTSRPKTIRHVVDGAAFITMALVVAASFTVLVVYS